MKKQQRHVEIYPKVGDKTSNIITAGSKPTFLLPNDVFELIWFIDGPFKNFPPDFDKQKLITPDYMAKLTSNIREPSAVSILLPVADDVTTKSTPKPPYYPSYGSLLATQRAIYLGWLKSVNSEIHPGYVFLYYYGLERHLFFGQLEKAFDMITRLREHHKNASFLRYSACTLILASFLHNRPDLFKRYSDSEQYDDHLRAADIYLVAKATLEENITVNEMILLIGLAGRQKYERYIKSEPDLFKKYLEFNLESKYGNKSLPLSNFPIEEWPMVRQPLLANLSLQWDQRLSKFPSLLRHEKFKQEFRSLIDKTHETVKLRLREMRKRI